MVPEAGWAAVVAAFGHRLGAVDAWPEFQRAVWADPSDPTTLVNSTESSPARVRQGLLAASDA